MRKSRVLIVDDSATIRGLLTAILSRDPETRSDRLRARRGRCPANDQRTEAGCHHARYRDAEHERARISRENHAAAPHAGRHGLDLDQERRRSDVGGFGNRAPSTISRSRQTTSLQISTNARTICVKRSKQPLMRRVRPLCPARSFADGNESDFDPGQSIIAIGSSTGGVEALIEVLSHFPENCPPTVITQHMPARFTTTFAERLDRLCKPSVTEATDGDQIGSRQDLSWRQAPTPISKLSERVR